eukprot:s1062_g12.t1
MGKPLPSPGPGEVQVQIAYAGVNFIDVYFREGTYASTLPFVPALEGAGVVQSAGPGAEVWLGRRVAFVSDLPRPFLNFEAATARWKL